MESIPFFFRGDRGAALAPMEGRFYYAHHPGGPEFEPVLGSDITLDDFDVGKDLQNWHSVSLARSPPHPVDLVVTVADPAIALISRDHSVMGAASINFNNLGITSNQYFYIQGLSQGPRL